MAFTDDLFDPMLNAAGSTAATASLHTDDPGSSGDDEVSGGAYERRPVSWAAADGGTVAVDGDVVFDVPASTTVSWLGLWDSSDGWLGGIELSSPEEFTEAGTYTVTTLSITAQNPS